MAPPLCYIERMRRLLALALALIPLARALPQTSAELRGADAAFSTVSAYLDTLPIAKNRLYVLTASETESLIDVAAQYRINVFELIDCAYRHLSTRYQRVMITGDALRATRERYDLGDDRVLAILPIDSLVSLQVGSQIVSGQNPLDIVLSAELEKYIEIGTAQYKTHFGFKHLGPLLFDDSYGITVRKLLFSAPLDRLELYAPGKGAVYVQGLSKPKRWNLRTIKRKA